MVRRRWRASEIGHLGERYTEDGLNQVAVDLDRSLDAISSQARRLGLRSPHRHRRQALARALNNKSVNVRFFDRLTDQVAYALGYIWVRGRVKTNPRHVLKLRCPASREVGLLEVRRLLMSQHRVQRRQGHVVCEISSYWLAESLIRRYGRPPDSRTSESPLPQLTPDHIPHFARGLLTGAGCHDHSRITWTANQRLMNDLKQAIRIGAGVGEPDIQQKGRLCTLSWRNADEVRRLRTWLHLFHVEDSEMPLAHRMPFSGGPSGQDQPPKCI